MCQIILLDPVYKDTFVCTGPFGLHKKNNPCHLYVIYFVSPSLFFLIGRDKKYQKVCPN